jgi:hypothetical protein
MQSVRGRTLKARSFATLVTTIRRLRNILRALTTENRRLPGGTLSLHASGSIAEQLRTAGKAGRCQHQIAAHEAPDLHEIFQVKGALKHAAGTPVLPGMPRLGAREYLVLVRFSCVCDCAPAISSLNRHRAAVQI